MTAPAGTPEAASGPALEVEGLWKSFGSLHVLRGIDLALADHDVVCLIGSSGSGKSTLLRCINLLDTIDAGRIVLKGADITARGVDVNTLRRRIGIVFQSFNLFPLSGGQQQRVAIVRALAMSPDLLLLDEITSALDPELVADVLDVIRELAYGGMTMLIATHEMGFARDIASRVCFLDHGVILEQGTPAEMFSEPREARTRQFLQRIIEAGRL